MKTDSSTPRPIDELFHGFEPLEASFVLCPNQFFDFCIQTQKRGTVRLTGYVLYQTLRWMDVDGRPMQEDIPTSYASIEKHAGVSRGDIRPSLENSVAGKFIECTKPPKAKSTASSGEVGEYRARWCTLFEEEFQGFYAGEGRRTPVPHSFFTVVLPTESLAVIRVVAAVLRQTVGYATQFGGRRKQIALSYSRLQVLTGLSRKTLSKAINTAITKGYIIMNEKGVFSSDIQEQSATVYSVRWQEREEQVAISSKRLP